MVMSHDTMTVCFRTEETVVVMLGGCCAREWFSSFVCGTRFRWSFVPLSTWRTVVALG